MGVEICKINRSQLKTADFPLNHDCILKVCYNADSHLRWELFSCRSIDSGLICNLFTQLYAVCKVLCYSVDDSSLNNL